MSNTLKKYIKQFSVVGLMFPAAYDADKKGPSATLLFMHLSFYLAFFSIIVLSIKDIYAGVIAAILYSITVTVLYLMRRVSRFKVDLDDKNIELEGENENP